MAAVGEGPLTEIHHRLRFARERAGFKSAAVAAKALEVPYGTYSGHENGLRGIKTEELIYYAKRFGVSVGWLLTGEGPTEGMSVPIVGLVGADPEGAILFSTSQGELGQAPLVPGATTKTVAVEVRGSSMQGIAENGSLVYYNDRHDPPTADLIGQVCVVGLEDGRVLIKRLMRGGRRNTFDLLSFTGANLKDQRVLWAAPVLNVLWPGAR